MCDWCRVETEGQGEDQIVEKGLDYVSNFDGGLSRSRKNKLAEEIDSLSDKPKNASRVLVKSPGGLKDYMRHEKRAEIRSNKLARNLPAQAQDSLEHLSLVQNASGSSVQEDGSNDNWRMSSADEAAGSGVESVKQQTYISIFDPIREPSFRPSNTKPLPKWMSLLPTNVHRCHGKRTKHAPIQRRTHRHGQYPPDEQDCVHRNPAAAVTEAGSLHQTHLTQVPQSAERQHDSSCSENCSSQERINRAKTTRNGRQELKPARRSQTSRSSYQTAFEHPVPLFISDQPAEVHRELHKKPSSCFFAPNHHDGVSCQGACYGLELQPSKPKPESVESSRIELSLQSSFRPSGPVVANSSEYVDRYQPKTQDPNYRSYVAKDVEPIMDRIRKQRTRKLDDGSEESKNKKTAIMKLIEDEFRTDPKRGDLNRELKNLFSEK
ncbi:hypothetical protein BP5796_04634 [Coleophoma crateriformis]|uniref:Uncharacterized protein n=1 Tax=Coleophoma crateriformis TaxID=565419 RepID=A0A3D8SA38_9HELO|nr:hypothetical protein BP5796_04634 [Coleophoma crateriformis]